MSPRLAALDFIAGCLSVCDEPSHNDALCSAIESGRFDWQIVIGIANAEFVTPALWVALRNRQLNEHLPADVYDYLRELHRLNAIRNARLKAQAIEVVQRLNAMGVEPLLLKGAVGLFVETFPDPGSRVMTDLDILVPEAAAEGCWNTLCEAGYRPVKSALKRPKVGLGRSDWPVEYRRHQHLIALYRPGEYAVVEVHRSALSWSGAGLCPTHLLWRNAQPVQASGATMVVPPPTDRILHNLVHSAIVDRAYLKGRIPLRPLHEIAQLQIIYRGYIDWEDIRRRFASQGKSRVLQSFLYLSHRFFGSPLPDGIPRTLGSTIHYARARLQARWDWPEYILEPVFDFWAITVVGRLSHLSAENICARYQCDNDFLSVTRGRIRLVLRRIRLNGILVAKYTSRAFRWILNRFGIGKTAASRN